MQLTKIKQNLSYTKEFGVIWLRSYMMSCSSRFENIGKACHIVMSLV